MKKLPKYVKVNSQKRNGKPCTEWVVRLYDFSIENEKFFFVGHKSGNSNLVQILKPSEEKRKKFINTNDELDKNKESSNYLTEKENPKISSKIETKKPLEQVNISDLLALHKKS